MGCRIEIQGWDVVLGHATGMHRLECSTGMQGWDARMGCNTGRHGREVALECRVGMQG